MVSFCTCSPELLSGGVGLGTLTVLSRIEIINFEHVQLLAQQQWRSCIPIDLRGPPVAQDVINLTFICLCHNYQASLCFAALSNYTTEE